MSIRIRSSRLICRASREDNSSYSGDRCELDSHADTCCVGPNFVMYDTGQSYKTVNVYGFNGKPSKAVPVTSAATYYQDPTTGHSYILVIHQALYFGDKIDTTLLNPNQMRLAGVKVYDTPKQFDPTSLHALVVPAEGGAHLTIPLTLDGVCSGFSSRAPTQDELEAPETIPHLELTMDNCWDPKSSELAEREEKIASARQVARVIQPTAPSEPSESYFYRTIASVAMRCESEQTITAPEDDELHSRLVDSVCADVNDLAGNGLTKKQNDIVPMDDEARQIRSVAMGYSNEEDEREAMGLRTGDRKSPLTPEVLAKRFNIGLETAKRTIRVTTQYGFRNVYIPAERRSRQKTAHLRFPQLAGKHYSDTMFSNVKSVTQSKAAQVFTNGLGFDRFYPMRTKEEAPVALMTDIQRYGIPQEVVTDNAWEETKGDWLKICKTYRIRQLHSVPYSHWQIAAERSIGEAKKCIKRKLRHTGAPKRLWCHCGNWVTGIRRHTALDMPQLKGKTPTAHQTGRIDDISAWAMFDWYQPVWYWTPTKDFPHDKKEMGRWIGVDEDCIAPLAFLVLTESGEVMTRKDVWAVTDDEMAQPLIKERLQRFDESIKKKMGDGVKDKDLDPRLADVVNPPETDDWIFDEEEDLEPMDPGFVKPEADDSTPEQYDQYLSAEVLLPHGGELQKARVISRKRDANGNPVGIRDNNPMLDTREYEVEFVKDKQVASYTANMIAENIYANVDQDGRSYSILDEIIDHKKKRSAVSREDVTARNRITTKGWFLLVRWKDGSTSWIPLKDLKDSNPVQVAEYAVVNKLVDEPAFKWWVNKVLRRRDVIISKVKSRYWSRTHKFGIEMPKTVEEALRIDRKTGTDFWRRAIEKEMKNVMPAFEFKDGDPILPGWKHIRCHMVFDIKSHDLTRKARLVAGGHLTDPPKESTYSSVVSRDSVRLAFLIAALNDLDVLAADVQNAYLNAPTKEKIYTTAGLEFGPEHCGRPVYIVRALYGLKSSAKQWGDHMAETLRSYGFKSCLADPDVWMKPACKKNGERYYEYVLVYVDDVLCLSESPQNVMEYLSKCYTLKEGSVQPPDNYLGAEVRKWNLECTDDPSKVRWGMSSDKYVRRAVADVETELAKLEPPQMLKPKAVVPISTKYRPELDTTPELDGRRASYYMSLIGILRWTCELGRVDILMAVSMMSRYMAAPREGHLEQVLHIFAYLKHNPRSTMVFNDEEPDFQEERFTKADWSDTYGNIEEVVPPNAPEARGKGVTMTCFVDASHAGCHVTRRSWTGIMIFVNKAPIMWYSKRQNTVESSTFTSEFVAAKIAVEMIEGLRYKLRMMGIPINGATNLLCDNESVVKNSTRPDSPLKKKHCAIAYHRVREAQAAGVVRIAWEDTDTNLADLFTKLLDAPKLKFLAKCILW